MDRLLLSATLCAVAAAGCHAEDGPLGFCDLSQRFAPPSSRLTVDGRALRDAASRQVLLRGINAGGRSKLPPFFPFEFRESGEPDQAAALEGAPGCAVWDAPRQVLIVATRAAATTARVTFAPRR